MKRFSLTLFIFICVSGLFAQESISSSGGDAAGDGGTINFTVGQIATNKHIGISTVVSEGVQQAYEISEVVSFEIEDVMYDISAYPNPTANKLILRADCKFQDISYQLYDIKGRIYEIGEVTANESHIDMSYFDPAIYFLQINKGKQMIKTFKIIKY